MYHLRRHRAFYYVFFGDKKISEGLYRMQAEKKLAELIEECYSSSI